MAVQTFTATGNKATVAANLPKDVFGLKVENFDLVKLAYNAHLANGRTNNAVAKTRGEVRGSTKKPWRQKGTGRARVGSKRSPLWRKGGIIFGPTGIENYSIKLTKTIRAQALRQALSIKNAANSISVVEDLNVKDAKTKSASLFLSKLGANKKILIVCSELEPNLIKAVNNLPGVVVVSASRLNTYQVMNADSILIIKNAIASLEDRLGAKK